MQKNSLLHIGIICVLGILLSVACENNNELDLYGPIECDTNGITWENSIKDILAKNCVECHGPKTAYNRVRHDSYEAELIVVRDGRLIGVINHLPGYIQMPFNRPKLPVCELKKINVWLESGAPEN